MRLIYICLLYFAFSLILTGCFEEFIGRNKTTSEPTEKSVIDALVKNNSGAHKEFWGEGAKLVLRRWNVEHELISVFYGDNIGVDMSASMSLVEKKLGFPIFKETHSRSDADVIFLKRNQNCSMQVNGSPETIDSFNTPPVNEDGVLQGPIYIHLNKSKCGSNYDVTVRAAVVAAGFVRLHTMRPPGPSEWKALETLYHNPPGTTLADADILW